MFGFKLEKALPYLLGGAFLFWIYKKYFNSFVEVEEKVLVMSATWGFKTEKEKKAYLLQSANYIYDRTWGTPCSWLRDTSEVREFIHKNKFCLLEIAAFFEDIRGFGHFYISAKLSDTILSRLHSDDFILLDEEYNMLVDAGY